MGGVGDGEMSFEDFVGRWGLQEDAQTLLLSLDPTSQTRVMQQFAPRDTARDVNPIFIKFAQGVAAGTPQMSSRQPGQSFAQPGESTAEMEAFVVQWSLGPEAQQLLVSLQLAMRQKVMQEFSPRDTTRDCNVIFIKFAQGIAGGKGKGFGKGFGKGAAPAPAFVPVLYQAPMMAYQPPVMRYYQPPSATYMPPVQTFAPPPAVAFANSIGGVEDFIAKWNLDNNSQSLLLSLDAVQQQKLLQEFRPRDASRDVNAIFCKFASGIAQNRERGGAVNNVKAYLAQWNLSADAQNLFFQLQPAVQNKIMLEFAPRDTQRDVSNIFMKFAQGVGKAMAGGFEAQGQPRFMPVVVRSAPY